ncbi:HEPN domain-containing protein [Streptomyces sp. NPDC024017]|uniref:HEPN domain-containing protein n=1 Tax=Streptomyces sp. NPDC024017 TaxID=3154326 RepID=UPI00340FEB27
MALNKFRAQLVDVEGMLDLVESITLGDPSLSYLRHRLDPSPLLAGAVVLLCARFEEFLKEIIAYALERHSLCDPPMTLWDLPENVQVHLISKSLNAALQGIRHGEPRTPSQRITEGVEAAKHVVGGNIKAEHAIETGGNPGPKTVAELMKLVGVDNAWKRITEHFDASYTAPTLPTISTIAVGKLEDRLGQIMRLRNIVAHSGANIPSSPAEIRFNVAFLSQLSTSIYEVLKDHVQQYARSLGRQPAAWQP